MWYYKKRCGLKISMSLDMRLRELADNYKRTARPELQERINLIAYGIINMFCESREERKEYRDLYYKAKFPEVIR